MANEKKHEMDKKNFNRMNATLREYLDTIKDVSIKAQINDIYKKIQKQLDPATLVEVESTDNTLTYFCTSGLKEGPGMYWGKGGSDISSKMGKETNVTIHAFTTRKGVRNMSLDVEFNQYPNTKYYEEYKALEDNKPKNIDLKHGNIAKSVIDISKSIATEVAMDFKGIAIQSNPYKEFKTYKFEVEDTTEDGGNITCVITEGGKRVYKDNRGEKDKRKVVDRHKVLKFVDGKEVKAYEDILQG